MENPYQAPGSPDPAPPTAAVRNSLLQPPVRLRGAMTLGDVVHAQWLLLRRRWWAILFCLATYVGLVVTLSAMSPLGSTYAFIGLIAAPMLVPFGLICTYVRMRQDAGKGRGLFAETETELGEAGIQALVGGEVSTVVWSDFRSFAASDRVALLFVNGSNNHLIVARGKLVDDRDWARLLEFLNQRWPAASA